MIRNGYPQVWAGRLCLAMVAVLCLAGYYYENIRFLPAAAGFGILAVICYLGRRTPTASRSLGDSGRRRAL